MRFNLDNIIMDKVEPVEMWRKIPNKPKYPKWEIFKCSLGCLIGSFEAACKLDNIVRQYTYDEGVYNNFQEIKDTVKYNQDHSEYLYSKFNQIKDLTVE